MAVLVAADRLSNAGEVHRGVSAGSVYLGGKTPEQAEGLLAAQHPGTPREVRLGDGPRETTLDLAEAGADLDLARTVDRAYAVGRTGGFFERLADRQPAPASVSVRDGEAEVARSREGYALDVPATARNVGEALGNLRREAPMAGEAIEPGVSTPEAEEAAGEANRAMSRAVALTGDGGRPRS